MSRFLRQSTASQTRTIGPFVDDGDFKTLENGLTIANTDVLLKKNGAASGAKNSGGATADAGGMYHLTFDATDTATVGELFYSVKVAGALVVFGCFTVLEEDVYDALFAANAPGPATAPALTTVYNALNADTDALISTIGVAGAGLTAADDAVLAAIAALNNLSAATVRTQVDNALIAINLDHLIHVAVDTDFPTTVHINSVIGHLADDGSSATFDRSTDSLEAARNNVGTAGAGLTAADDAVITALGTVSSSIAALNNISTAQVRTQVDDALIAINLDHLVKVAVDTNFATTVHLDSVIGHMADNGTTASFSRTTDSLEAIRDRGDAAWITGEGGGGGAITGAFTITLTVTNGVDPIENAKVRISDDIDSEVLETDAAGEVTFTRDAATYDIAISHPRHTFAATELVVTTHTTEEYEMTPIVIASPSGPDLCVITATVLDGSGVAVQGATFRFALFVPSGQGAGANGNFILRREVIAITNASGALKAQNGTDPFELVRNDEILPAGSYYKVTAPAPINLISTTISLTDAAYDLSELFA